MAATVSLCMIVRNEAEQLPRCLESVQGAVDEIVIVDTGSTDQTVGLARAHGAVVREIPWPNDFAAARNASLALAACDWVLYLDADEVLTPESRQILPELLADESVEGYLIQIRNLLGSAANSDVEVAEALRLFRNRPSYRFVGAVHEQIFPAMRAANPQATLVHSALTVVHYGYLQEHVAAKGKAQRNLRLLEAAVAASPGDPFVLFNLGLELLSQRRFGQANRRLQQALDRCGPSAAWRPKLVKCQAAALCELGQWGEALALLTRESVRYGGYTDLTYMAGVAYSALHRHQEAAAAFAACLTMGPADAARFGAVDPEMGSGKAQLALGQELEALERHAEAMQAYAKAAMSRQGWIEPIRRLACLMARRVEEPTMARVLEAFFPGESVQNRVTVAALFAHAGRYRGALRYLEPLWAEGQLAGDGQLLLARCLAKADRCDEALRLCAGIRESGELGEHLVKALEIYCQVRLDRGGNPGAKRPAPEVYDELASLLADDPAVLVETFLRSLPRSNLLARLLKRRR